MSGIPAGAGSLLGKRLGKYEILALLALGGTAEIYLARIGGAAGFEKYVVVKCLHDHLADDQEFVKMFLDEARLAAHLDHSNIVQTMELGEHENRYYMVMEFLAGLSLAMIVRRASERLPGGRVPIPLVLNLIAQTCAGLHYAHERAINGKHLQIVHRDISPQNLVISFEGVAKVVDFGIAKAEMRETKTRSGTIKGKFAYMSPEQCVATNVDRRTDVFALGVILWEMLTGKRLFKKSSPYETYQAVIECNVDLPSKHNHEVEPAVDAIVMKAMAKDKDDRYPTAEAFGDALAGYLHHRGKGSGPNEIGRFFDVAFAQEIEEHGARMRELIAGREEFSADMKWGADDEKGNLTVDQAGKQAHDESLSMHLSDADLLAMDRPSVGGLTSALDDLDLQVGDESDMRAESTRIEQNPHALINEMERASQQGLPHPAMPPLANQGPPSVALQPQRSTSIPSLVKPSGAPVHATASQTLSDQPIAPKLPSGTATTSAPGAMPSEPARQRPLADPLPAVLSLPAPPQGPVMPHHPHPPQIATTSAAGRPAAAGSDSVQGGQLERPRVGFPAANLPTMIAGHSDPPPGPIGAEHANTLMAAQVVPADHGFDTAPPYGHTQAMPPMPAGYPMMNPQMSAHIARGGDIYPSAPSRGMPRASEQSLPQQQPRRLGPESGAHAANLMSPVGQHYPDQVDWEQAAAMPARALPKWMLVALFAAAIVGALLVTLIIAKIAR